MKRLVPVLLASAILLIMLGSVASAFTMSEKVVVANELVAIARVPAGGLTAQERIDRVNERLAYILGLRPLNPGAIQAVRRGNSMLITVGGSSLMTVTSADARANNTTVQGLTNVWLRQARAALPDARPTPSIPG